MQNNDKVSVVITTYKREFEVVERAVKSVLAQTYKTLELIVVDDNMPDSEYRKSMEKGMEKYPDVIYIKHSVNSGAQISRNDGIMAGSGSYFAFLDDDDIWYDNKLECQMKCFGPEVGLVYCKGYSVITDGDKEKKIPYNMSGYFIDSLNFEDMLYGDYIGTTTQAVISAKALETCGMFDTDMPARQDYEMWIRISRKFKCVGANEFLFEHFIHQGEQISKNKAGILKGYKNIYKKYKPFYTKCARFHIMLMISKVMKKQGMYIKAAAYAVRSGFWFISAFLFEHAQLKRRMEISNNRKK